MSEQAIECPRCTERFSVPVDAEHVNCPVCGELIEIGESDA